VSREPTQTTAELVETDGERIALLVAVAVPPGATLRVAFNNEPESYTIKVRGCRREPLPNALYRVEGRLQNLTRAGRHRLAALTARRREPLDPE
jgi:hypothetical protein